ncbi:hypothetical protein PAMP_012027 [Pampus punctatissimus]
MDSQLNMGSASGNRMKQQEIIGKLIENMITGLLLMLSLSIDCGVIVIAAMLSKKPPTLSAPRHLEGAPGIGFENAA